MVTTLSSGSKVESFHTEAEKLVIQQTVGTNSVHQHFSESKRYPSFLRFVTIELLKHHPSHLKNEPWERNSLVETLITIQLQTQLFA